MITVKSLQNETFTFLIYHVAPYRIIVIEKLINGVKKICQRLYNIVKL